MKFVPRLALAGLVIHVAGFFGLFFPELASIAQWVFLLGFGLIFLALFLWFGIQLRRMHPKPGELLVIASAFVLGFLTWSLSERIGGHPEPWDGEPPYYLATMLGSGLICGALAPRMWLLSGIAVFLGQLIPANFGLGMFGTIGTASLVIGTAPALLSAWLASLLVQRLFHRSHQS